MGITALCLQSRVGYRLNRSTAPLESILQRTVTSTSTLSPSFVRLSTAGKSPASVTSLHMWTLSVATYILKTLAHGAFMKYWALLPVPTTLVDPNRGSTTTAT